MADHRWSFESTSVWTILACGILLFTLSKGAHGQDCFFINDMCGWSNEGDIDWVQRSHPAVQGVVHRAEVSVPNNPVTPPTSQLAVLASPFQPHVMTMLGFYYRLVAPNTLTVIAELDDGSVEHIWSRNGTDGTSWIEVDVPVPKSKSFKISFQAFIPENSTSFVGITNVTLTIGADECASMPCLNSGDCIDGNNSFTCVCRAGFRGEICQIDTNPPPKTTETIPTTISTAAPSTIQVSSVALTTPQSPESSKPSEPSKNHTNKTPPSTDLTVKSGTLSTPAKLPQTNDDKGLKDPVMITVIAVASAVVLASIVAATWLLVCYVKKRSWRPRYHERGMSMESVSNAESTPGKWTSSTDIPGSIPTIKRGELPPVEENGYPRKVENIYVSPPTLGLVNTGYNIDSMY